MKIHSLVLFFCLIPFSTTSSQSLLVLEGSHEVKSRSFPTIGLELSLLESGNLNGTFSHFRYKDDHFTFLSRRIDTKYTLGQVEEESVSFDKFDDKKESKIIDPFIKGLAWGALSTAVGMLGGMLSLDGGFYGLLVVSAATPALLVKDNRTAAGIGGLAAGSAISFLVLSETDYDFHWQ